MEVAPLETVQAGSGQDEPLNFFLDSLYRAEGNRDQYIDKGSSELNQFIQGFNTTDDKIDLLEFEQDVLTALKSIPVQGTLRNAEFLQDLVKTAKDFAHAQLSDNPTEILIEPSGFLDQIWDAGSEQEVFAAADSLEEFFITDAQIPDPISNIAADYDEPGIVAPGSEALVAFAPLVIPVVVITAEGIKFITVTVLVTAGVLIFKWYDQYRQQIVRQAGGVFDRSVQEITNLAQSLVRELFAKTNNDGLFGKPEERIDKQLQGTGQLRDLQRNKNWDEEMDINEALRKTPRELKEAMENGEISKRGFDQNELPRRKRTGYQNQKRASCSSLCNLR